MRPVIVMYAMLGKIGLMGFCYHVHCLFGKSNPDTSQDVKQYTFTITTVQDGASSFLSC